MPRLRAFAVLAALLIALAGFVSPLTVSEATARNAHAWVEISSTRPGPGCTVHVAIEIRASGVAVSNTEVSIGLFSGSTLVAIDRAYTDGHGVAHLAVVANGIGADGWLDLNVGGVYIKGYSIGATPGNSCTASPKFEEFTADIPAAGASSSSYPPFYTYTQQRNLSCEFAAVTIATKGAVSEYDVEAQVPLSPNPHWGYRGNIHGQWGNTTDYGVYAEPLAAVLSNFGYRGEVFYGGWSGAQMIEHINNGAPVIVWLALWGDLSHVEETDGSAYRLTPGMHVMVAYDYDEVNVYLSDPANGSLVAYGWVDFRNKYGVLGGMSLAIYPA